jgi:hypothetical protein
MLVLFVAALAVATSMDLAPIAMEAVQQLAPRGPELPGFSLEHGRSPDANGFLLFEGILDENDDGDGVAVARVLVSKYNGDVWDASTCEPVTSESIRRAQAEMRRRLHLAPSRNRRRLRPERCAAD